MRLSAILLTAVLLGGCATGYYQAPETPSTVFLSNGVALVGLTEVNGDCRITLTLKSGKQVQPKLADEVCAEAASIIATEQRAQALQPRQAPPAAATPPPTEER